jgi:hypothetical protein
MNETIGVTNILKSAPEELINIFLQAGAETGRNRWIIGDAVVLLGEAVREKRIDATVMDCYIAASIWLNREVSPRTVAYYSMVAGFFPQGVRLEFDGLPFSHFALAHSLGDRWRECLQLSSDYAAEKGYPPSAAWLKYQMNITTKEAEEELDECWNRQTEATIRSMASDLRRMIADFSLPDSLKGRVLDALDELIESLKFESVLDKIERE